MLREWVRRAWTWIFADDDRVRGYSQQLLQEQLEKASGAITEWDGGRMPAAALAGSTSARSQLRSGATTSTRKAADEFRRSEARLSIASFA